MAYFGISPELSQLMQTHGIGSQEVADYRAEVGETAASLRPDAAADTSSPYYMGSDAYFADLLSNESLMARGGDYYTNIAQDRDYAPLAGIGEHFDDLWGQGGWEKEFNTYALNNRGEHDIRYIGEAGMILAPINAAMRMLEARGAAADPAYPLLQQYYAKVEQALNDKSNAISEAKKKQMVGQLMQGISMIGGIAAGGVALSGALAGGAAGAGAGGAMDMGIGFGGNTLEAIGLAAPQPGMFSSLASAWDSLGPLGQSAVKNVGQQLLTTGDVDFQKLAMGVAGPALDMGWAGMGGLDGLQSLAGADAPPVGYMSDLDLGGYADMAPAPSVGFNPFAPTASFAPGSFDAQIAGGDYSALTGQEPTFSVAAPDAYLGVGNFDLSAPFIDAIGGPDQYGAGEFGEDDYAAQEGATMQSVDEPIPAGQETFGDDYGAETPAEAATETGFSIKPSTILQVAKTLFGLLGGEGKAQEKALRKVVEREYANEAERQAAYYAYAQELLGYVPSVSEAYALDPQNVNTQFGNTFIDPETGEVRYELTPGTQAYHDALMQGAKDALDKGLGVDTDQLTAEQLEKAIASLQGKRDKDMATLTRALYARGLLGLVTYQGAGKNLLTGETETWSLEEGQGANPYFAAEMARRERENYDLARLSRGEAENYMTQLLNHSGGLLGKAKDVDQQMIEALFQAGERTDEAGNVKRKKGKGLFDLVAGPGGAFMQQLMGSLPSGKAAAALADADQLEAARRDEAIRRFMEEQGN